MTRMPANSYAVFAFGIFLGIWPAKSASEALHDAADDEGIECDTTRMLAHLMTEDDWKDLTQWHEAGCPAGTLPMSVREAAQCSS
jgi:hypothetical protein